MENLILLKYNGSEEELYNGSTEIKKFQYAVPFAYHFDYRHIVDDKNGLRHMYPSLEQIWVTNRWATCVFTFLSALSEVNTYLAFIYFVFTKGEMIAVMEIWSKLVWEISNNIYLDNNTNSQLSKTDTTEINAHNLTNDPMYANKFISVK